MRKLDTRKSQRILATVLMGVNFFTVMAPKVAQADCTMNVPDGNITSVNGETVDFVQFITNGGTATNYTIAIDAAQTIYAGGLASNGTIFGKQMVSGGSAHASIIMGGTQYVYVGGSGTVGDLNIGAQEISGGYGKIENNYAEQSIVGGTGIIANQVAADHGQIVLGGSGTIENMAAAGYQTIFTGASGTIGNMTAAGKQDILYGAQGNVSNMSAGIQSVNGGGTGTIINMSGGTQYVDADAVLNVSTGTPNGVGKIETMVGGTQHVSSGGTGIIQKMTGGEQNGDASEITVVDMSGGSQFIFGLAHGFVETMSGGSQYVMVGGTGTVTKLLGGTQNVVWNGTAIAEDMLGGTQIVSAYGTGIVNKMSGGSQIILEDGMGTAEDMSNGQQFISSGGTGTVTNLLGGTQMVSKGGTSLDTKVTGGIMQLVDDGAIVENPTITAGKIRLNGDGGSYKLNGVFTGNGGMVDMSEDSTGTKTNTYETVTIENLTNKNTTFLFDTDLNSETDGDKVIVNGSNNGGGVVQVYDASIVRGNKVYGNKKLLLVTDNSADTTWTGKSLDTGGLWNLTPWVAKEGNDWYLEEITALPNDSTKGVLGTVESGYGLWRNTILDDTLRKRLGDLRYEGEETPGIWARVKAGKLSAALYDGSYQMYQVGVDKKRGNTAYGLAVDYSRANNDITDGTAEGSNTGLSLYAATYHKGGAYSDIVLRAGKVKMDMESNGTIPDTMDYGAWGYSASYELGKTFSKENGWFIEPQAQLAYGRLQGGDFTTNRGVTVSRDGVNSFLGRLGFVLGRKIKDTGDYYFKANVYREFAGSGDMNLAYGIERMNYDGDHKDTWFEMGLGTNVKLNNSTYFYGDVLKTFGADIQKKWQINAGLRWTWGK